MHLAKATGHTTLSSAACAVLMAALLGLSACAGQADRASSSQQRTTAEAVEDNVGIHQILETWKAGNETAAMELLLMAAETGDEAALRMFSLSEREFLNLRSAEQDAVQADMLEQVGHLRKLSRKVRDLGVDHARQSQHDLAARHADTLIKLGAANTGDDQTELANAVGQAIQQLGHDVHAAIRE